VSGTDGLTTANHGCTGVHQRKDSQLSDGLGIEATGIMVDSHSSSKKVPGGDGRTEDGLNIPKPFPSSQQNHMSLDHAELITRE